MHPFSAILPALSIVTGPRISPLASLNLQANPLSLSSCSVVLLDPAFVDSPESRKPNDACEHITSADPADSLPVLCSFRVSGQKAIKAPLSYPSSSVSCPDFRDVPLCGVVQWVNNRGEAQPYPEKGRVSHLGMPASVSSIAVRVPSSAQKSPCS